MGRREIDGTFKDFMQGVLNSALFVEGLTVDFDAPRIGRVKFGWDLPFTVKGREIPLGYYPPVGITPLQPYRIQYRAHQDCARRGEELLLDFDRGGTRTISVP